MKGRAVLVTVALALSALVACGGEAPTSPPAVAEYQFPSDQESWQVFAHGTDMLKGATGQRVKDAILGFLERQ